MNTCTMTPEWTSFVQTCSRALCLCSCWPCLTCTATGASTQTTWGSWHCLSQSSWRCCIRQPMQARALWLCPVDCSSLQLHVLPGAMPAGAWRSDWDSTAMCMRNLNTGLPLAALPPAACMTHTVSHGGGTCMASFRSFPPHAALATFNVPSRLPVYICCPLQATQFRIQAMPATPSSMTPSAPAWRHRSHPPLAQRCHTPPHAKTPSSPLQVGPVLFQPRSSWAMVKTSVLSPAALHVWPPISPAWLVQHQAPAAGSAL